MPWYESLRAREQVRALEPTIQQFIAAHPRQAGSAARQTVFLFPGGLASRLARADRSAYRDPDRPFTYRDVWLTPWAFMSGARQLRLTADWDGMYYDADHRIIVASGLVTLAGHGPYDGFLAWARRSGLDVFVIPWDWRRNVAEAGRFFVDHFLRYFQLRIEAFLGVDPLERFSLIGHSAGGMVVNWILRREAPILATLDQVITVATPFYGYGAQLHRWFEGERYLNGGGLFKRAVIRTLCRLPGCYAWNPMPYQMYQEHASAFAADPVAPLTAYPSLDATTGAIADPYSLTRYSAHSGFDRDALTRAADLLISLAGPLSPSKVRQFWNIRGNAAVTRSSTTWREHPSRWRSPIADVSVTVGDGVQPGWTARHVDLETWAPGHVITIAGRHATLLDHPETHAALARILTSGSGG